MHDDAAWLEGRDGEEEGVDVRGCGRQDDEACRLPLEASSASLYAHPRYSILRCQLCGQPTWVPYYRKQVDYYAYCCYYY